MSEDMPFEEDVEEVPADSGPPETPAAAPCPPVVRVIGTLALLMGATLPAIAGFGLFRFPEERVLGFVAAGLSLAAALLLALGGSAFLAHARWGRIPLAVFAWTAWPAAAGLAMAASNAVVQDHAPPVFFLGYAGAGLATAVFGLLLAISLLFGRVAAWGDGMPGPAPQGPSRQSTLALLSLIFAFVPPWGVMHLVSLLLGTLAIGSIRRARGGLHGRGLAIAGISVSGSVLMLAFAGVVAMSFFMGWHGSADEHAAGLRLRELAVLQRLHGELDWDHDGRGNPCTTTLTALLDSGPRDGGGGPLDAATIRALRAADYGVLGDRAVPLAGYVFRLEVGPSDADGTAPWTISARPSSDRRARVLRVNAGGEPWASDADVSDWRLQR